MLNVILVKQGRSAITARQTYHLLHRRRLDGKRRSNVVRRRSNIMFWNRLRITPPVHAGRDAHRHANESGRLLAYLQKSI